MEACSANQSQPMSPATLKRLDDSTIVSFVQKGGTTGMLVTIWSTGACVWKLLCILFIGFIFKQKVHNNKNKMKSMWH